MVTAFTILVTLTPRLTFVPVFKPIVWAINFMFELKSSYSAGRVRDVLR